MNNNKSKITYKPIQERLVNVSRIILISCSMVMILSACSSTTSESKTKFHKKKSSRQYRQKLNVFSTKTDKPPFVETHKQNLAVKSEARQTTEELISSKQNKIFPTIDINNIKEAINYCGKTRMLSMRMANLYGVQVLQDYPSEKKQKAKEQLEYEKSNINNIYNALLEFSPATKKPELNQKVRSSQVYWFQLQKILSEQPTKKGFLKVLDMSDNLLRKNDTMTRYFGAQATDNISKFINIAGRQQMYSMKLARDYLAASMDIDKENRMDLMLETINIFDSAMLALEGASSNTAEIQGLIKSITKMEWRKVYQTVNQCIKENGTKFNLLVMINFCETLLEKTDRLTILYTEAG